jgi:hypothetical protein
MAVLVNSVSNLLKSACAACGGHVEHSSDMAGQSVACPHCQASMVLPSAVSSPPVVAASIFETKGEGVFLEERGILVTKTRFVSQAHTFALASITSVSGEQTEPSKLQPIILLIFGMGTLSFAVWLGVLMLGASVVWMFKQKTNFTVVLTTAGGEVKAFTSQDRKFVARIIHALTDAIVARG